jgi:3-dehydroquinate dehydratase/shikimate dehydrogenase
MDWRPFVAQSIFGKGKARVAAVVATTNAREFQSLVRKALELTPTVELRLDWLANDLERAKALKWLKAFAPKSAVFIATCRRRVGGGELVGGLDEELFWLMKARESGCTWCDLEIETLRELPGRTVKGYVLPPKMMLSIHDFRRTPKLPTQTALASRGGVDAVKIAAMSRKLADAARVLRLARKTGKVVAVPMGEIGLPGRILALRQGSALTYAPVAAATAPGQVPLRELMELYRAHELTRSTRVFGVIGYPIGHSLSPLLHNSGYVAAQKDAVYLPFLVENLREFLDVVKEFGIRGFSVTIPHKEKIFPYLDDCEPLAEKIGAVNTVTVSKGGKLRGSNTDYVGVLRALEKKMRLKGSRVLILGAGGSARAAAFALASAGSEVLICARRENAMQQLARAVHGGSIRRAALCKEKFDAIVNTTPVGMHPHMESSPLHSAELNCSLLMDLIYRPLQTKLLRIAVARGIKTVSGFEMFLAQGVAQWELWMGGAAPQIAMRNAVLKALRTEEHISGK